MCVHSLMMTKNSRNSNFNTLQNEKFNKKTKFSRYVLLIYFFNLYIYILCSLELLKNINQFLNLNKMKNQIFTVPNVIFITFSLILVFVLLTGNMNA